MCNRVLEPHKAKQLLNQCQRHRIKLSCCCLFKECQNFHPLIIFSSPAVEESSSECSDEPVAVGDTPHEDATFPVLPYDQIILKVQYSSQTERYDPFLPLARLQFQIQVPPLTGPACCVQCVRGGRGRPSQSQQSGLPDSGPPGDVDPGLGPQSQQPDKASAHLLLCEHKQVYCECLNTAFMLRYFFC